MLGSLSDEVKDVSQINRCSQSFITSSSMPTNWSERHVEIASGFMAGFSTTIATHPLDLIKVRLQLSTKLSARPFDLLRDVITNINKDGRAVYEASKRQKPLSLCYLNQYYRGVGPNLVGNVSAWALYFSLYNEFKHLMPSTEGTTTYFTASTFAGLTIALITNPIWVLKTRILSTSSLERNSYKSLMDGASQILKNEGLGTFWKGSIPSMFLVFQASLNFTFYNHAKDYFMLKLGKEELLNVQYMYASVFSKTASMILMYPSQVVRSRLQRYNFDHSQRTLAKVFLEIWKGEGKLRGFYRGLSANIVRVLPSTIITFVSYEMTKQYLSGRN